MVIMRDFLGSEVHALEDLMIQLREKTHNEYKAMCEKYTYTKIRGSLEEKQSITSRPDFRAVDDDVLEAICSTLSLQAE